MGQIFKQQPVKQYAVTYLSKEDLEGHISEESRGELTDGDMEWLAGKMELLYLDSGYHENLRQALTELFAKRGYEFELLRRMGRDGG